MTVPFVFRVRVRHDRLHEILRWIMTEPSNSQIHFLNLEDKVFDRSPDRMIWMYLDCPSKLDYLIFKYRLDVYQSDIDQES